MSKKTKVEYLPLPETDSFGQMIAASRLNQKKTQLQLANRIGIKQMGVSKLEHNKRASLPEEWVSAISECLNHDPKEIKKAWKAHFKKREKNMKAAAKTRKAKSTKKNKQISDNQQQKHANSGDKTLPKQQPCENDNVVAKTTCTAEDSQKESPREVLLVLQAIPILTTESYSLEQLQKLMKMFRTNLITGTDMHADELKLVAQAIFVRYVRLIVGRMSCQSEKWRSLVCAQADGLIQDVKISVFGIGFKDVDVVHFTLEVLEQKAKVIITPALQRPHRNTELEEEKSRYFDRLFRLRQNLETLCNIEKDDSIFELG